MKELLLSFLEAIWVLCAFFAIGLLAFALLCVLEGRGPLPVAYFWFNGGYFIYLFVSGWYLWWLRKGS